MFSAGPLGGALNSALEQDGSPDLSVVVQGAPVAAPMTQNVPIMQMEAPPLQLHDVPPLEQHVEQRPDFWYDPSTPVSDDQLSNVIAESLASANAATGLTGVRQTYGLTGKGQTVAVIDTGTAYDHYALGGGFGANYRVVGGWDFAESDADPYDDAPSGGHGTHVSGIVGGNMSGSVTDSGVAPGVDLVSLRVFDDNGNGYYSWVDSALQWVHTHRTSFANPITAVNLSLGSAWNADTIPSWAMLEDSLTQLESDGIVITISAGNAFTTYNSPGLSYPAASPHVVPVMSVDDSGSLSYFSQRSTRAIGAPGHFIVSTVPDYGGNHNGITDDFASYSGTSMASPYIAGASVLVREVMQMVGQTNINEWTVYNELMNTADSFVDSATGLTYKRLNMTNAISSLIPTDDYGSSSSAASNLGSLSADRSVSGLIGSISDADYFKFTAIASGTVTITATANYELSPTWTATGGTANGNTYTFQVTAGQTYNFGLSTSRGIGTYSLAIHESGPTFAYTNWGTIAQWQASGVANTGTTLYRVTASQTGYLTAEANFTGAAGAVTLAWYDGNQQQLAAGSGSTDSQRVDLTAAAGQQYYLVVTGNNADIDFRLTDLVSLSGTTVTVNGTSAADSLSFLAGASQYTVSVNGAAYQFNASAVNTINFAGGGGSDSITMTGSSGNETATLRVGNAQLAAANTYTATATNVENVTVYGGGGTDSLAMYDSSGDDTFTGYDNRATISGAGFLHDAFNFASVVANASTGNDQATLNDSSGDDSYTAWTNRALMTGAGYSNDVRGFDHTLAHATTGNDTATFVDGAGNDIYSAWSNHAVMYGTGYFNDTTGFESTLGISSGGADQAFLNDSAGDDTYTSWWNRAVLSGSGYTNEARNFARTKAGATTGNDTATFNDSTGNDTFLAWPTHAVMYGTGYFNDSAGFDRTLAIATTGNDTATFTGSAGNDIYSAAPTHATMYGTGYFNDTTGFESTLGISSGGADQAFLSDSAGDDTYTSWWNRAVLSGSGYSNDARNFARTWAGATTGNDTATFNDSTGNDTFLAWPTHAVMFGTGYFNDTAGFKQVVGYASGGIDQATVYDSAGDDTYDAWSNRALMTGSGYSLDARGFDSTYANASTGYDQARLHDSAGSDTVSAQTWGAYLSGKGYYDEVRGFDHVTAYSTSGGKDKAFVSAVDYLFEKVGKWK